METARTAVSEVLADTYDCLRVWTAWHVGAMSEEDFEPIWHNDERLDEVVNAVASALQRVEPPFEEPALAGDERSPQADHQPDTENHDALAKVCP